MPKYIKKKDLKNAIDECTWYHINKNGELVEGANSAEHEPLYKYSDIKKIIKGLPTRKFKDEQQIDDLATAIANGAYCRTCEHLGDEDCDCDIVFTGYEPKDEPKVVMPKECKGCDSASKIIESYSKGFEDGAEAVKAVQTDCSWK